MPDNPIKHIPAEIRVANKSKSTAAPQKVGMTTFPTKYFLARLVYPKVQMC